MDELLGEFLVESGESLTALDQHLLDLETDPSNLELIKNIFRILHTLKGTCGFLGLTRLEKVAHISESVLGKIRDGALHPTGEVLNTLFESLDHLKTIVSLMETTESEGDPNDDAELLQSLQNILDGVNASANKPDESQTSKEDTHAQKPTLEETSPQKEEPSSAPSSNNDAIKEETPTLKAEAQPEPHKDEEKKLDTKATHANESVGPQQSIRVNVTLLDNLMTLVSELVLTRNQLIQFARQEQDSGLNNSLQRLSNITTELQEAVMGTRMQPIQNAWTKIPRIVRDLSHELGKKIDLEMIGGETDLDRQVLELIKDPLTHMIRNSADHGLEMPQDRIKAGKKETGLIRLKAYHEGGHIIISIEDDGKGLPLENIRNKAIEKKLATQEELDNMTDNQIYQFIFKPGFSTAQKVTNVSGRGVGMDVVRSNIEQLGGSIELSSSPGKGSRFLIKIPLTLTIVSSIIIESAGLHFAIPQISVIELVRASFHADHQLEYINEKPVLRLRNHLLPLVILSDLLNIKNPNYDQSSLREQYIVVMSVGALTFGLVVDKVFDTQEIVVKPLSKVFNNALYFSGTTILGDGSVVMILDPNGVASDLKDHNLPESLSQPQSASLSGNLDKTLLLVFRAGQTTHAVPLALVTRLDEVPSSSVDHMNNTYLVQYRSQLLPILSVQGESLLPLDPEIKSVPLLIFSDHGQSMGIVISEIIDIVEDELDIQIRNQNDGSLGSTIILGRPTNVIDCEYYLKKAYPNWFDAGKFPPQAPQASTRYRARILLVDDSHFFRSLIVPVLKVAGYDVVVASSAIQALDTCKEDTNFDIIISDIDMPEMDGLEFTKLLRKEEEWKNAPIIALSGHAGDAEIKLSLDAGFTAHIPKSDQQGLIQLLSRLTGTT